MERLDLTIKLVGMPAEESGGGKVPLLERGVFDDVAMARLVHPAPEETSASSSLAISDFQLHRTGTAAHTAAVPNIIPTNTSALFQVSPVCTQLVPDAWLAAAYRTAITGLGRSLLCPEELSPEDEQRRQTGSTDMGNVSITLPAIHPTIAIDCDDAVNHQPEFATVCHALGGSCSVRRGTGPGAHRTGGGHRRRAARSTNRRSVPMPRRVEASAGGAL